MALLGSLIPAIAWVWYFLKKTIHKDSVSLVTFSFLAGAIAVWITIPLQQWVSENILLTALVSIFVMACIEECLKFLILRSLVLRIHEIRYRSDYVLYMTTAALGFAMMENCLYLLTPLKTGNISAAIAIGNLRFFGSTVVHATSSALHGLWVGLALEKPFFNRAFCWCIGLASATLVHGAFNFYIAHESITIVAITLLVLWSLLIVVTILFHKSEIQFGYN